MQQAVRRRPQLDFTPAHRDTLAKILGGLRAREKSLPTRLLYDARGSELFEQICELDEYYLTRTELGILRRHIDEMAGHIGPDSLLIEYGSGSGTKTQLLLDALESPVGYVPIEISSEVLRRSAEHLARRYPNLAVLPVCADYLGEYELPTPPRPSAKRVVFFPGSTIGNFRREDAADFLRHIGATCGAGGGFLVGVDLHKETSILEAAYDDAKGVTAEFERNALAHLNREFDADFDLSRFAYESFYNERERRIEMYLVSSTAQRVRVADATLELAAGERILLEYALKFTPRDFAELAGQAGFDVRQVWTDPEALFSVQYLTRR